MEKFIIDQYTQVPSCYKCGSLDGSLSYRIALNELKAANLAARPECIALKCRICGYVWYMRCKDYEKVQD